MKKHQDDANSGVEALQAFASQFGSDDPFTRLVMEIVLEELFNQNPENYKSEER
jgi:hypothetical protein